MINLKIFIKQILLVVFVLYADGLSAQEAQTIRGKITDEKGEGLPGATILEKGTSNGSITDVDGLFSLTVSSSDAVLILSFVGYISEEVKVRGRSTVNMSLLPDITSLNEVVVIGYGSVDKKDLTGSVGIVDGSSLEKFPTADATQALQGRVAGVQVSSNSSPGGGSRVSIRGISTVSGDISPLYVVDGVYRTGLGGISPNDIESISVLKDASAAAIYGVQAANGVVIVTTKTGKSGTTIIDVNLEMGVQTPSRMYDVMNSQQFGAYSVQFHNNSTPASINLNLWAINDSILSTNTDWQDAAFSPAPFYRASVSGSGGNEFAQFRVGANYFKQDGVMKNTHFDRLNITLNSSFKKSFFEIGENLNIYRQNDRYAYRVNTFNVLRAAPQIPLYDPSTLNGYGVPTRANAGQINTINPLINLDLADDRSVGFGAVGNIYAKAYILDGLTFKTTLNYDLFSRVATLSNPRTDQGIASNGNLLESYRKGQANSTSIQFENYFNYDKLFGKHKLGVLAGISALDRRSDNFSVLALRSDGYQNLDAANNTVVQGYPIQQTIFSYLSRLTYSYADKYLATVTLRRDGLSSFANTNNRFGSFPSFSLGWRLTEETFMKTITWISDLKVRGGYGELGRPISLGDTYLTQPLITLKANSSLGNRTYPGAIWLSAADPNLKWETATQTNIGVDLALMDHSISITSDYFIKKSSDQILDVEFPDNFGLGQEGTGAYGSGKRNIGSISNTGFEFSITYAKRKGNFNFETGANFTYLTNTVDELFQIGGEDLPILTGNQRAIAGESLWYFYGFETDGLYQTQDEIPSTLTGIKPGDVKIIDRNNDGRLTEDDFTNLGNSIPKYYFGGFFSANYKAFDLSVLLEGKAGFKVQNDIYNSLTNTSDKWIKSTDIVGNYWTPDNTGAEFPRVPASSVSFNFSDRLLQDGAYLNIQNVQLGYNLKDALFSGSKLNAFRVYISVTNPILITAYKGFTPDTWGGGSNASNGSSVENTSSLPYLRTYTGGIQLKF